MTNKPPSRSRIGYWKKEMSPKDVETFERIAGPLLHDLGYSVTIDLSSDLVQTPWIDRLDKATELIESAIPEGSRMILLDQEQWGVEGMLTGRTCFKFTEKNGQYWGPPEDDDQGIGELERLREIGAEYLVFAWPAFWMKEHFSRFNQYLLNTYPCLIESDDVVIYDLGNSASGEKSK